MFESLRIYAHRIKERLAPGEPMPKALPAAPSSEIAEIAPIHCRPSNLDRPRLNLIIPALSMRYAFGGIQTAIEFFLALNDTGGSARIIITDEMSSDLLGFTNAAQWTVTGAGEDDREGRLIICFGDRYNKTIPVRQHDIFIATAWWTAYNAQGILDWQKNHWKRTPPPLVYLVQDFEPGFYKWSSRYLLAQSTYRQQNMIAVINTQLLADYFLLNGIHFQHLYVFEPVLNQQLQQVLQQTMPVKKKTIIFYGRPSIERNAFEIIINGLLHWSEHFPGAAGWNILSLGETYTAPDLHNDCRITVLGKTSMEQYGQLLAEAAIGISLMVSPHPSYPPLEMAAFGAAVITNSFANKNLSAYHDNIFSLQSTTPAALSQLLATLCGTVEQNPALFQNKEFRHIAFAANRTGFDCIPAIRSKLPLSINPIT
jgi:O-antigen biosynthesis protein